MKVENVPSRNSASSMISYAGAESAVNSSSVETSHGKTMEVELTKGTVGLGFCIEGGKGSPLGDKPVTVKRLFKGKARVL